MALQNLKKILVALDGSKKSFKGLDMAITLARQFGSSIVGLCVIPVEPPIFMPGMSSSFKKKMTDEAKKFLDEAEKTSKENSVTFKQQIIYGIPSEDVVSFANKHGFDLIIIGGRGHSLIREVFLGSVAHSTVHKSKIPVLVIK
jgi:nucleotide-binding universal stress UspA family protein